ncbi:glycosyltransferase family 4 protein [Kurthia sibirica]|uniref:Undecaprenyl-phosphate alpha-N-acetylglucosaminyl 1-phosphate transferase n=1 Tax=Kurthia sibirica TaxID=202750 RepID=A0A2U3AML6_9BACL|nr:MraY family glycosyltransferase [Kurthia sibirica]PWI25778.1 undecaprenyl-phosphate alpha-N-acetylglucosaminyl 1-phosphate transferase [Kurthia sibirica]GEK35108.1 undecaprenyl-phosphate alpha-N-acetylglucosaminyl 1-phosphate transferase [Kurthia sibirica]
MHYLALVVAFIASILLTPVVKKLAYRVGAVDRPNYRKVHAHIMPRLGGLAIFLAFLIGVLVYRPENPAIIPIIIASFVIIIIGVLDDMLEISAKAKFLGQTVAAAIVIFFGDIQIASINIPFGGVLDFGYLSIPLTLIWIVGITNAINLIDGLDGLAAGVSSIALLTLAAMAFIMNDSFVLVMALMLVVSTVGFLFYNFHPAKIFMGDTGALFLGFIISVLALMGFKNVTFVSLVIPIIMLGVPISDTFFAIVRRLLNKQPPFQPDKSHLHHRLISIGFTHRQTVLIIYGIASMFGLAAIIFSMAKVWGAILLVIILLLTIELFVEVIGLAGSKYRPLLNLVKKK